MATFLFSQKRSLIFLFSTCIAFCSFAQSVSNYGFSSGSGTYTQIAGTTPAGTGSTSGDNITFANIPIGFDFWYMGQRYTAVSASAKGWFTFGSTISNSAATNNLTSGGSRPVIAPLWDDIARIPGILFLISPGTFSYETLGTTGSRRLILQWSLMRWDLNAPTTITIGGDVISFQAIIYEATGNIEFIYQPESRPVNNGSASVGITAVGTGAGNFVSVSSIASANPSISTTTETTNINAKPSAVTKITFDPAELPAPSNLTFTAVGNNGMTLNWTDLSTGEVGFAIYRSTNATSGFTYVATTAANATSYVNMGLAANTTYYYRVYTLRENLGGFANGSQTTLINCNTIGIPLQIATTGVIGNYKLNGNANDFYNINNGTLRGSPSTTANRFDVEGRAYSFNGTNQYISTANSYSNPNNFTLSVWFKTTTTVGGSLLGLNVNQTGVTGQHDRHLYMGVNGRVYFGNFGGSVKTVNSGTAYNDGQWHLATATMSSTAGIALYIDGMLVASDATATTGENYAGYWRLASQQFNVAWPSAPTSSFFAGALDDAFIFQRILSPAEIATLYASPYGLQNNGPVCVGSTLQLSAPTIAGAQYSWVGPNGFSATQQNPTLSYSLAAAGNYTLTVNIGGCTDIASIKVTSSTVAGQWTGNAGGNWTTANSWCNGVVPLSSVDVTIPAGSSTYPTVSTEQSINNLTIGSGATITITNALSVSGTITNSGTITASAGKMIFNSTLALQTIPANLFTGNFIKDLTLNNTYGVGLNGALRLTGVLTAAAGVFQTNGHLTLASSATSTASVATIPAEASIRGVVKVERYLQGGAINPFRTYRMLSSPVYDNSTNFINSNVEGNRSAKFSQLIDDIIISNPAAAAGGFDVTHNNQPGAWNYNAGFTPIEHINTAVNAGKGMYVFFRGNRDNFNQKTYVPFVDPENTIVDFDGVLNQQDITVTLPAGASFLGNPYAATLDWDSPNWGADKVNVENAIWVWRPETRSYATYIGGVGTLGGSRYIASGQSFFVRATAAGSIKFKENVKAPNQQPPTLLMSVRSQQNLKFMDAAALGALNTSSRSIFRISMKPQDSFGEDETVIVFNQGSSAAYDHEDALHIDGEVLNLSSLVGARKLAINFMAPLNEAVEIPLHVNAAATGSYKFQFNLNEYTGQQTLVLRDKYLNSYIPIASNASHSFEINKTNAQTFGANRFSISVAAPVVLSVRLKHFTANKQSNGVLLAWATLSETNFKHFEVYRTDMEGLNMKLGVIQPKGAGYYNFVDHHPRQGNNYYQLKKVNLDGSFTLSEQLLVQHEWLFPVKIYPNPVVDKFTVQLANLSKSSYHLVINSVSGKILQAREVSNDDLETGYEMDVNTMPAGLYFITVREVKTGEIITVEKLLKN